MKWSRRYPDKVYPVATGLLVLVIWEATVAALRVPPYLLPAPSGVVAELVRQWDTLVSHAATTMIEVVVGFTMSLVTGILLGLAIVNWRLVERSLYPLLVSSQTIPKVAVAPLFIIWFGFGITPKILIVFLMSVFPVVINTVLGLRMVNREMIYLVQSMGGGRGEIFRRVALPVALPAIFTGLKMAAVLAVVGAIVGEFVGSDRGLGYVLTVANGNLDAKLVFATVLALSTFGLLLFFLVELAEWVFVPWNRNRSATARMEQL